MQARGTHSPVSVFQAIVGISALRRCSGPWSVLRPSLGLRAIWRCSGPAPVLRPLVGLRAIGGAPAQRQCSGPSALVSSVLPHIGPRYGHVVGAPTSRRCPDSKTKHRRPAPRSTRPNNGMQRTEGGSGGRAGLRAFWCPPPPLIPGVRLLLSRFSAQELRSGYDENTASGYRYQCHYYSTTLKAGCSQNSCP